MINTGRTVDSISDHELVRRVIRGLAGKTSRHPLWSRVMDTFSLGSTFATQLCVKHGFNLEQTKYVEPTYSLAKAKEPDHD